MLCVKCRLKLHIVQNVLFVLLRTDLKKADINQANITLNLPILLKFNALTQPS